MQTRLKANLAVAVSVCGSLITLPYVDNHTSIAILHHGFLAATIGGMADWFAVKAIFGKPLGISYRTDILRNNRQRIMQGLIDFSANDLLRVENIMLTLKQTDFSLLLITYLKERGGMQRLKTLAGELLHVILSAIDTKELAVRLEPCFRELLNGIQLHNCLSEGIKCVNNATVRESIIKQIFTTLEKIILSAKVQNIFTKYITDILQEYESGGFGRSFMMSSMGLTADNVVPKLNEQCKSWLRDNRENSSAIYQRFDAGIEQFFRGLEENEEIVKQLNLWKADKLEHLAFVDYIEESINSCIEKNAEKWQDNLFLLMDAYLVKFENSPEQKKYLQQKLYVWLEEKIYKHKETIPLIMKEQLDRLSDDELVQLAEKKVEDDLQMIRINGAIVGAFAGMVLYSLSCVVLRGLGA